MKEVSVVLVGIGGYGNKYVEHILKEGRERGVQIAGAVDPSPQNCRFYEELRSLNVPIYDSLEEFYSHHTVDLAIVSSPIHYHCEQTCLAVKNGSHVLCEKPAAATVKEVKRMIECRDRYKKIVAIGYQWSYNPAVLRLKKDILSGRFGRPVLFKTIVLWPRDTAYYRRNSWAGKMKVNGRWVLDSVAGNATAHFLHNMFFLLGEKMEGSAYPDSIVAELYRANDIESFDTCALKMMVKDTPVFFFATHAVKERIGPVFEYRFEKARVLCNYPEYPESAENLLVVYNDGKKEVYGPTDHGSMRKLWIAVEVARGKEEFICTLESAMAHTIAINGAHISMKGIQDFPDEMKRVEGNPPLIWVEGLKEAMEKAYKNEKIFSELGLPWAKRGEEVRLGNFEGLEGEITC
ncbi:Gfo/Idh/MocA family protein [Thermotoga sp. SG1]|uniref:Gfo/Idh/MocA family protein n=1 Tax=Thermotoga sp. SG1 TaxID=126739 RepID=UPI000C7693E7|nr:Gfo/Idh/MocA family oxidoreductase [Thermotoga sp. SG1]PLV57313.1 oxidoreductase [Thermotoga sp. SG1]